MSIDGQGLMAIKHLSLFLLAVGVFVVLSFTTFLYVLKRKSSKLINEAKPLEGEMLLTLDKLIGEGAVPINDVAMSRRMGVSWQLAMSVLSDWEKRGLVIRQIVTVPDPKEEGGERDTFHFLLTVDGKEEVARLKAQEDTGNRTVDGGHRIAQ